MNDTNDTNDTNDMNRDPITGAPGSHPVGTGVGGVGGAAIGAAIGSVFGPIGTLVGGAIGTMAGASVGHSAAERIDPTGETEAWRGEAAERPYYDKNMDYDRDYAPAYRYGTEARNEGQGEAWETEETRLKSGWGSAKGESRLAWDQAREPVRDAWQRSDRTYKTYDATDRHFEQRFNQADYYKADYSFDDYKPAYRYGTFARSQSQSGQWDENTERQLESGWNSAKGTSRLTWADAKAAVKDAWNGVERILPGDSDHDGR
ncbi:hypothetical protein [Cognatilysobacter lacus]|uniref:Glycine zipper domain-containing protein n=1 Tax=Cognatilysobacter lacus TaxID=1643323 RepID=A0A5D8Z5J2_9GAMM|nr:hypothetical protein [Lysobacter lacus]TZF89806.1 hypothetical protein FW784_07835 [Lysobacter lacus]